MQSPKHKSHHGTRAVEKLGETLLLVFHGGNGAGKNSLQGHTALLLRIGIGKWLEHLAPAALETLLLSDLFLLVDVGETAWNLEIEDKLVKQIQGFVG